MVLRIEILVYYFSRLLDKESIKYVVFDFNKSLKRKDFINYIYKPSIVSTVQDICND